MNGDGQLIEKLTYLSSLVSNVRDVDPMLDTLRDVTASRDPQQSQLSDEQRAQLQQLERQLNDYLLTKDPVRAFTPESLQAKVEKHLHQTDPHSQANRSALRSVFLTAGLAMLGYAAAVALIPAQSSDRFTLAGPVPMLIIGIGVAWIYLLARSSLVPSMKKTFTLFAAAVIISAITSTQYPFLTAYPQLADHPIMHYGGFLMPYVIMYGLFYVGFYRFARQFRASILVSILHPRWIGLASVVLVAAGFLIPTPPTDFVLFFKISLACLFLDVLFLGAATVLGLSTANQVTPRYARALRMLALAAGSYFLVCTVLTGLLLSTGDLNPSDPRVAGISGLYMVALLLEIVSAYLFKRNIQEE